MLKKVCIVIGILVCLQLVLVGINIMQKGGSSWKGRSIENILGVAATEATLDDVKKLSKADVFQLFYAAPPPEFTEMKGEYSAVTLNVGVLAFAADFFTYHFFGPGYWEGKAFYPFEEQQGWGYNLFSEKDEVGTKRFIRTRRMNTWVGPSTIDDKVSFHLDYSPYNTGLVHSMHDEIRKINDRLFIGLGYMAAGGGSLNPAPFVLHGAPQPWQGIDPR